MAVAAIAAAAVVGGAVVSSQAQKKSSKTAATAQKDSTKIASDASLQAQRETIAYEREAAKLSAAAEETARVASEKLVRESLASDQAFQNQARVAQEQYQTKAAQAVESNQRQSTAYVKDTLDYNKRYTQDRAYEQLNKRNESIGTIRAFELDAAAQNQGNYERANYDAFNNQQGAINERTRLANNAASQESGNLSAALSAQEQGLTGERSALLAANQAERGTYEQSAAAQTALARLSEQQALSGFASQRDAQLAGYGRQEGIARAGFDAERAAVLQGRDAQLGYIDQGQTEASSYQQPYYEGGTAAFKQYQAALGIPGANGEVDRAAQQGAYDTFRNQPGYQAGLTQGMEATQASAASRAGLFSGATLKALTKYGTDYADQVGWQPYLNRLEGVGQQGQQAGNNLSNISAEAARGRVSVAGDYSQRNQDIEGRQGGTLFGLEGNRTQANYDYYGNVLSAQDVSNMRASDIERNLGLQRGELDQRNGEANADYADRLGAARSDMQYRSQELNGRLANTRMGLAAESGDVQANYNLQLADIRAQGMDRYTAANTDSQRAKSAASDDYYQTDVGAQNQYANNMASQYSNQFTNTGAAFQNAYGNTGDAYLQTLSGQGARSQNALSNLGGQAANSYSNQGRDAAQSSRNVGNATASGLTQRAGYQAAAAVNIGNINAQSQMAQGQTWSNAISSLGGIYGNYLGRTGS